MLTYSTTFGPMLVVPYLFVCLRPPVIAVDASGGIAEDGEFFCHRNERGCSNSIGATRSHSDPSAVDVVSAKLSVMAQPKQRRVKLNFLWQDGRCSRPYPVNDRKGYPVVVQQHSDHPDGFRIVWNTHENDHRSSVP